MKVAFTLIELIIVMLIIVLLVGMLSPILSIASKTSQRSANQSLLAKVDAALRRFKMDIGVYPYWYYNTSTTDFGIIDNRLAYHLAHDLTAAERTTLLSDADRARRAYDAAPHRYTAASPAILAFFPAPGPPNLTANRGPGAQLLNRMGKERAGLMIHAGNIELLGFGDNTAVPVLSAPAGTTKGWASDYLGGDLNRNDIQTDAIMDTYGEPLLYSCPVTCGISGPSVPPDFNETYPNYIRLDETYFGLQAVGRTVTTALGTDMRTHAARAFAFEFELWSSGPDGMVRPVRTDRANKDNHAVVDYAKGLIP